MLMSLYSRIHSVSTVYVCSTENTTLFIAFLLTFLSFSFCAGRDELYESKWFAYNALEFLRDRDKPRKGLATESIVNSFLSSHSELPTVVFLPP
jgi:hypothetical protein